MASVLIAATSPVVRAGLETLVGAENGLTIAGNASDVESLLREVEATRPDVVVLDFESETEEALGVLLSHDEAASPPAIIALTTDARAAWVAEAFRSGLNAVLPHEAAADTLIAAILAAAAGLFVLTPNTIDLLLHARSLAVPDDAQHDASIDSLTPREVEVLGMLAEGTGNKTIAYRLGISEHTVKFHVASIFSKLSVSSRTEAVTVGIRQGLIML